MKKFKSSFTSVRPLQKVPGEKEPHAVVTFYIEGGGCIDRAYYGVMHVEEMQVLLEGHVEQVVGFDTIENDSGKVVPCVAYRVVGSDAFPPWRANKEASTLLAEAMLRNGSAQLGGTVRGLFGTIVVMSGVHPAVSEMREML